MTLFKMGEFVDMAIRDEETGIAFYNTLAEITTNDKIREGCKRIAKQEEAHAARFRKMLEEVGTYTAQERSEGEYEAFLTTLLTMRAFPEPALAADKAKKVKSDAEALDLAMGMEKETLLFLNEMRPYIPETHQSYIDDIVNEERQHLVDLADLKKHL